MIIAVTGGIGSGKSTLSANWESHGAHIVSSDEIAREVVLPGTRALGQIVERWGSDVVTDDGALDRPALARIVFERPDELAALNGITHPAIFDRTHELIDSFPNDDVVLLDIPLLVGSPIENATVANVLISVDEERRITRLVTERGFDAGQARARIRNQATDEERAEISDLVVFNNGSKAELRTVAEDLWNSWVKPFRQALRDGARQAGGPERQPGRYQTLENVNLIESRLRNAGVAARYDEFGDEFHAPRQVGADLKGAGWVPTAQGALPANPFHRRRLLWSQS